jgi:uncharacterized protein (TIGR02186 family)
MMRLWLLMAAFLLAATGAQADKLTIALSTTDIQINAAFNGVPVTVFGVLEGDDGSAPATTDYEVAIVVIGPRQSAVLRRKDRVLGVWANSGAQTIINPPSFYAISTSTALDGIASPAVMERLQLGFDNLAFVYQARALVNDPGAAEYRDAFIRLKEEAGLFAESEGVSFVGDYVFRTTVFMPTTVPVGTYTAIAYVLANGELVARAEETITVSKTGAEATLASFARSQALVYGILCVALALAIGWLGGVIFRRD